MTRTSLAAARVLGSMWAVLAIGAVLAAAQVTGRAWRPLDVESYWAASFRLGDLYPDRWAATGYNYAGPPPVAQLFSLVHGLPFAMVELGWLVFLFGCLWYACRGWTLVVIGAGLAAIGLNIPVVSAPLGIVLLGNVGMAMTAGVIATVRDERWSVLPFAAKIGPAVALLWHGRRAWRGLVAIGAVLAISAAFTPSAWPEWIRFVAANYAADPVGELVVPFWIRAPLGIALVLFAARRGTAWLVPIGAGCAIPADYGVSFLTVWIGALAFAPSPSECVVRARSVMAAYWRSSARSTSVRSLR